VYIVSSQPAATLVRLRYMSALPIARSAGCMHDTLANAANLSLGHGQRLKRLG
jgi:hypothetical protein